MTDRRSFLLGLGAALAAPAIVKAENIMPLFVPKRHSIITNTVVVDFGSPKKPDLIVMSLDFYDIYRELVTVRDPLRILPVHQLVDAAFAPVRAGV